MQAKISLEKYIKALESKYPKLDVYFLFPELMVLEANGITSVSLSTKELRELKEWL